MGQTSIERRPRSVVVRIASYSVPGGWPRIVLRVPLTTEKDDVASSVVVAQQLHTIWPCSIRVQNPNRVLSLRNIGSFSTDDGTPILAGVRTGAAQNRILCRQCNFYHCFAFASCRCGLGAGARSGACSNVSISVRDFLSQSSPRPVFARQRPAASR